VYAGGGLFSFSPEAHLEKNEAHESLKIMHENVEKVGKNPILLITHSACCTENFLQSIKGNLSSRWIAVV